MSTDQPMKLNPRNVAAVRRGRDPREAARMVAGNPVSTRLEAGVGNCFPGLECDLRNLERRFFPHLEVDISDREIRIAGADAVAADRDDAVDPGSRSSYVRIADDLREGRSWTVRELTGRFGEMGELKLDIATLGPPSMGEARRPPDAWVAVRMLTESSPVEMILRRTDDGHEVTLRGDRLRYLDDGGALAAAFVPGELTQSLCSPWTHDFRDCGCFYWASNHPDIALAPAEEGAEAEEDVWVVWERSDRIGPPRPAADERPRRFEMDHYEINGAWEALNFVVEGRERTGPYRPTGPAAVPPLASKAELEARLQYAAGVELGVMLEYLTAAYSLRDPAGLEQLLGDDIRAAFAEILRIAVGEMRHLRAVNDLLRSVQGPARFKPALRVATHVPGLQQGEFRILQARPATLEAIDDFIAVEAPSASVDGLYAPVLAYLERSGTDEQVQAIRSIMFEGEDHFETFSAVREWLGRHQERDYLRAGPLTTPAGGEENHVVLQKRYADLLGSLYDGYMLGMPAGAKRVNSARSAMVSPDGIDGAARAVAATGHLAVFEAPQDPRFSPIPPA